MGQVSHVQEKKEWNLGREGETGRTKILNRFKKIGIETRKDNKLLKTLVCLERQTHPRRILTVHKESSKKIPGNVLR